MVMSDTELDIREDGAPQGDARSASSGRRPWIRRAKDLSLQWAVVAVIVAIWAVVTETGVVKSDLLPTVQATATAIWDLITSRSGLDDLGTTGLEVLGALVICAPLGIALGFVLGEIKRHRQTIGGVADNSLSTVLSTPKLIFLPVLVILLGASYWEKVIYSAIDGVVIVIIGTAAAAYAADGSVRLLSRSLNMNRWQFFFKIYLPGAMPVIVESLRLSVILITSAMMLAEMYISSAGMGYLIFQDGTNYDLPGLIAAVIVVGIAATIINACFRAIEVRVDRWRFDAAR
jgi:NitT/TauT family transport system permease protein